MRELVDICVLRVIFGSEYGVKGYEAELGKRDGQVRA